MQQNVGFPTLENRITYSRKGANNDRLRRASRIARRFCYHRAYGGAEPPIWPPHPLFFRWNHEEDWFIVEHVLGSDHSHHDAVRRQADVQDPVPELLHTFCENHLPIDHLALLLSRGASNRLLPVTRLPKGAEDQRNCARQPLSWTWLIGHADLAPHGPEWLSGSELILHSRLADVGSRA